MESSLASTKIVEYNASELQSGATAMGDSRAHNTKWAPTKSVNIADKDIVTAYVLRQ